ncbi:MAG: hypothetical protein V2A77_05040, partial [Pseudomonadota bacterium]
GEILDEPGAEAGQEEPGAGSVPLSPASSTDGKQASTGTPPPSPSSIASSTRDGDPGLLRSYDRTMVQSAAGKLRWDAKRLNKELQDRFGIASLDNAPDDKLHEAASKLTDLAAAAGG